ncbi:unnamed protein product, partial [Mesorhabditis belari]|uniref:Lipid-binding serum glycoprotein N-terminal domain-containing protein n=1 Tax=Mesorhabditis belari TaxID=2138241 RepID=A0AAF3EYY5_9BILA
MHAMQIVFTLLFVVNSLFFVNEARILSRRSRNLRLDPHFQDYFNSESDEVASIEYDDDLGDSIRDFESHLDKLRNSLLNEPIRKEKAVTFELPKPTSSIERNSPGIAIRITDHALEYVKEKSLAILRHDVMRTHPPQIEIILLGANLTIDEIKVVGFEAPTLKTEGLADGVFRIQTSGGEAKIRGSYKNIFKTVREGQFEALLSGFDLDFKFKYMKTFDGRLKLIDQSCQFALEAVTVLLQPELAPPFSEKFSLETSLNRLVNQMPSLVHFFNPIDSAKHFSQEVGFDSRVTSEPIITSKFTQVGIRGEFTSNRTQIDDEPAVLETSQADTEKMVYTYISDHSVSTFLRQLSTFGDVKFNLHVLPEIADFLRPQCAKFELCVGQFADLQTVNPASGRLVVRSRTPPRIRFHQGAAHIHLKTSVEMSYRKSDELFVVDEIYAKFDADLSLKLSHLRVIKSLKEGHYEWTARIHVDEISVDNALALNDKMTNFVENLPSIMNKSRKFLETLISSNLRSSLPLSLSKAIDLEMISTEFRERTLVVSFNLNIESRLFPHLSFVN